MLLVFTGSASASSAAMIGDSAGDTLALSQFNGFLRHNRFTAGDPGFASNFDFDTSTAGTQPLDAASFTQLTILAGAGDDVILIGEGNLDDFGGHLSIDGQGGIDRVILDDSATPFTDTYTITAVSVDRFLFGGLTYSGLEQLVLNAQSGGNAIDVLSTATDVSTTINGGAGDDIITLGSGNLDEIAGAVTVDGGDDFDEVVLDDSALSFGAEYTITAATVSRDLFAGLTYINAEGLVLNAQGGADTVTVTGTIDDTPVTVNCGAGDDVVHIGAGNLDVIAAGVSVTGGAGTDTLQVHDEANPFNDSYTVTASGFVRPLSGPVSLNSIEGFTLNGGTGDNTIQLNSTAAAMPVTINAGDGEDVLHINSGVTAAVTFNGGLAARFNDEIHVHAGTFTFATDAAGGTANLTVTADSGASVVFAATQHLAGLVLNGASATLTAGGGKRLVTRLLSIAGAARLDLSDNDLIVNYSGASPIGSWNTSSYTGIVGLIASGRNGGTWNGTGIITSMSAAKSPTLLTTLGIAEASDALALTTGQTAVYSGEVVDATTVLIKYTYAGDADLNGRVDADDYFWIDSRYAYPADGFFHGDFNIDGQTNGDDYYLIDSSYTSQAAPLGPAVTWLTTATAFWRETSEDDITEVIDAEFI